MAVWSLLLLASYLTGMASASCSVTSPDSPATASDSVTYKPECIAALESQVRIEMEASLQYLLMAAHFTQDTINLPNLATMFWGMADEERAHAIQFIEYLRMRGASNNNFFGGSALVPREKAYTWAGVGEALTMALKMEKDVTARMKTMIDACTTVGGDDPHAADWLTGTRLEEQLTGQRHLAGLINTFNNFKRGHDELAEWMFDQELSA